MVYRLNDKIKQNFSTLKVNLLNENENTPSKSEFYQSAFTSPNTHRKKMDLAAIDISMIECSDDKEFMIGLN